MKDYDVEERPIQMNRTQAKSTPLKPFVFGSVVAVATLTALVLTIVLLTSASRGSTTSSSNVHEDRVITVGRTERDDRPVSTIVAQVHTRVSVTDAEAIPLYPNAQNVSEEPRDENAPWRRILYFQAPATREEVIDFYKQKLAQLGWAASARNIYDLPASSYIGFSWSDPAEDVPYDLSLSIEVEPLNSQMTMVSAWLDREPNETKVPLYPDAQQVTVTNEPQESYGLQYLERLTTYESKTSPSKLEDFYKVVMTQSGWRLHDQVDVAKSSGMPGLLFSYFRGNVDHPWAGSVAILITESTDSLVKVEIRARGDSLDTLLKHFPNLTPTP